MLSSGYNWRGTLTEFARNASVLAGFCVTFVALILGGRVADINISSTGITFGQVAVLFFGVSSVFLICSAEFLLKAKDFDVFSIPEKYRELLREDCEAQGKLWNDFEDEQTAGCRKSEAKGRYLYNVGILGIFLGLFLVIAPYNMIIGLLVGVSGFILQLYQFSKKRP